MKKEYMIDDVMFFCTFFQSHGWNGWMHNIYIVKPLLQSDKHWPSPSIVKEQITSLSETIIVLTCSKSVQVWGARVKKCN
jgi:hypothetical protein